MRKSSLRNGAIVASSLVALIGIGTAVASAATSSGEEKAAASASSSPTVSSAPASTRPTSSTSASASAGPSASSSSSGATKCADVFPVAAPTGDAVGQLCAAVTGSGTTVSKVKITFKATSGCSGSVMLRASGVDQDGVEFADVDTVSCSSGTATASFQPVTETTSGTDICGLLIAPETYTGAQACVPIS